MTKADDRGFLIVEEANETIETWINKPFISDETRNQLIDSNFLIVPREGFRDIEYPVFPVGTEELFGYLRENATDALVPDICIDEQEYKELALHSDLYIIGSFIMEHLAAPLAVSLLDAYIKNKLGSKEEKASVNVEITVVQEGNKKATRIHYQGPAKEFQRTVIPLLQENQSSEVGPMEDGNGTD